MKNIDSDINKAEDPLKDKIKSLKFKDLGDEQGWGNYTPTATGITYKYKIGGSMGRYFVDVEPRIKSIRLNESTETGFRTKRSAKEWANRHNRQQIEDWLE